MGPPRKQSQDSCGRESLGDDALGYHACARLMGSPPALIIIVPVYNERDGIVEFGRRWTTALDRAQIPFSICFYDDGSTDGSSERLAALTLGEPRIVTVRQANRGHGPTVSRGYREHADAPWVFQVDADDTIGPEVLVRWWPGREAFDLLMASRADPHRTAFRRALSVLARSAVRLFFGGGVRDVNSPYRLVRNGTCRGAYALMRDDTLLPNVFLSGYACRRRLRVHQEAIAVRGRFRRDTAASLWRWIRLAVRGCGQLVLLALRLRRG